MKITLSKESLLVAISWFETRISDPSDEDGDKDAGQWLSALEIGNGTADLPSEAWQIIADDLLREADTDPPLLFTPGEDRAAIERKHRRWAKCLKDEVLKILDKAGESQNQN